MTPATARPSDLKRWCKRAHVRGLMVFLDVVYNHFGPDGNYLHAYAKPFFTERHHTPWGRRSIWMAAAAASCGTSLSTTRWYWLEEFNCDGLRFDAVHALIDDSNTSLPVRAVHAIRYSPA